MIHSPSQVLSFPVKGLNQTVHPNILPKFYIKDITENLSKYISKSFGLIKISTYICSAQGASKPRCRPKGEKGIPVRIRNNTCCCVSLLHSEFGLLHSLPLAKAGKAQQAG